MLIAAPTGWPSKNFLVEEDGKLVAEIDGSIWMERASATVGTTSFAVYGQHFFKRSYVMERGAQPIAYARKTSFFKDYFDVAVGTQIFAVRKSSVLRQTFAIYNDGRQIGTIRPAGIFKRRGILDGATSIPLEIRIFLLWIVLMAWRRQSS